MDWAKDGPTWPNAGLSRFVDSPPHRWHVQEAGEGPLVLLLHGAAGATHSWRDLLPILARDHHVVAPDLPGHGFTRLGTRQRSSLPRMADDVAALLAAGGWRPDLIVGHSAGAALGLDLAERVGARGVVGLNAALDGFDGHARWLFPLMAKLLALNPFAPMLFSRMAGGERASAELLRSTGSELDPLGQALYRRLFADRAHVDGTLAMMAGWDVAPLAERLPFLDLPVLFLTGARDATVPPRVSREAAARMRTAEVREVPGYGHLLHEEAPEVVAEAIASFLDSVARGARPAAGRQAAG